MKLEHISWELHIEDFFGNSEVCAKVYDNVQLEIVMSDALTLSKLGFDVFIVPYVYYTTEETKDED